MLEEYQGRKGERGWVNTDTIFLSDIAIETDIDLP